MLLKQIEQLFLILDGFVAKSLGQIEKIDRTNFQIEALSKTQKHYSFYNIN